MIAPYALFESWRGRYADSPRAISERLRVTHPGLRQVWVVDDPAVSLPVGVDRVLRNTPGYFIRLSGARYVVSNDMMPRFPGHLPRTSYLQTWHGTPLKTIGFDTRAASFAGAQTYLRRLARDVRRWDFLLSPSPYCTGIFRTAFGYSGRVLELGYPRNDGLRAETAAADRQRIRASLGIPATARVVLYAPTWRDDAVAADGRPTLPPELRLPDLIEQLDDETILLVRMHRVVADRLTDRHHPRLRDVSDLPEIQDLFLAADLLVTDYSSAMFDFAVTGRPIVFYAPDLDRYRDQLRGFYLDYAHDLPGPIARGQAELAELLNQPAGWFADYAPRYAEFVARFCPWDDGQAADRVVAAVFGSGGQPGG